MSFFDIRYLKSSNAVLVSRPKKYFETKYPTPFSPVNLESVTAQMPQITQLQQRIDDLFKIRDQSPANISQKIKLLSTGRRLKDDAQFKKTAAALFNGKQINIHYNGRGENATQTD